MRRALNVVHAVIVEDAAANDGLSRRSVEHWITHGNGNEGAGASTMQSVEDEDAAFAAFSGGFRMDDLLGDER